MTNCSNVRVMPNYVPIEYPKWVDGVQNAEEERARRLALAEAVEMASAAELARTRSPAGIRMRRTRERRREGKLSIRCDIGYFARFICVFLLPGWRRPFTVFARSGKEHR
jgi:hypothetical protein